MSVDERLRQIQQEIFTLGSRVGKKAEVALLDEVGSFCGGRWSGRQISLTFDMEVERLDEGLRGESTSPPSRASSQIHQSIQKLRDRVEVDSDTTSAALRAVSVAFDESVSRGRTVRRG